MLITSKASSSSRFRQSDLNLYNPPSNQVFQYSLHSNILYLSQESISYIISYKCPFSASHKQWKDCWHNKVTIILVQLAVSLGDWMQLTSERLKLAIVCHTYFILSVPRLNFIDFQGGICAQKEFLLWT